MNAELNEDWEDYEEPEMFYWIDYDGKICKAEIGTMDRTKIKQIGNYFETEEEAWKVVERLKAWKRLKDKGFRFIDFDWTNGNISFEESPIKDGEESDKFWDDLDLLFGGEE